MDTDKEINEGNKEFKNNNSKNLLINIKSIYFLH